MNIIDLKHKLELLEKELIEKKMLYAELSYDYSNLKLKKKNIGTQTNDNILDNLYMIKNNEKEENPIGHISNFNNILNESVNDNFCWDLIFDMDNFKKKNKSKSQNFNSFKSNIPNINNINQRKKTNSQNSIFSIITNNLFTDSSSKSIEVKVERKSILRKNLINKTLHKGFLLDDKREENYMILCMNKNQITKNFQDTKLKECLSMKSIEEVDAYFDNKYSKEPNCLNIIDIEKTKIIFEDFRPDIYIKPQMELLLFTLSEFLKDYKLTTIFISLLIDYDDIYTIFLMNEKKLNKLKINFENYCKENLKELNITYMRPLFHIFIELNKNFYFDILDKSGLKKYLDLLIIFKKKNKINFFFFITIIKFYIGYCNNKTDNNKLILNFENNFKETCNNIKSYVKSNLIEEFKNMLIKNNKKSWLF